MTPLERRAHFRQGLSSTYLPFYDSLCGVLGPEWQPYFGVRTFDQQTALYAQGRTGPGGIVTNARAGESAHNYGCGSDWTYFYNDQLVWLKKEDPLWQIYINAVTKVGLRPGAEFGDIDHNELRLDCDWKHVLLAYNAGNMTSAQDKIAQSLAP